MNELNSKHPNHWTNGGTGVTNFSPERRALYEATVHWAGDDRLVLSDEPFDTGNRAAVDMGLHSLHMIYRGERDLSDFWRLFDALKQTFMERRYP